jgi:hypothetical protein
MNIRFTSSLTPEDENMVAPRLMEAIGGLLDLLPIAYVIRIDTSDARTYERYGPNGEKDQAESSAAHQKAERRPRPVAVR